MERPLRFRTKAFTLVELLVAIAVVLIFVVLAVELATTALQRAEDSNATLRANSQARLVMDWLTRDLQTVLVRKDGGEWLRMEPGTLEIGSLALPVCRIMLFSQAGESHASDSGGATTSTPGPAAVSYEVDYCDPITLKKNQWNTTSLFRVTVNPRETFASGFAEQTPENLDTDFWVSLPVDVGERKAEHLLARNIAGLQIVFEFSPPGSPTLVSDAGAVFSAGVDGNVRAGSTTYSGATVQSAEVTLWLLKPEGVRALQRIANGTSMTNEEFFAKYARPFVRRIPLQSQ